MAAPLGRPAGAQPGHHRPRGPEEPWAALRGGRLHTTGTSTSPGATQSLGPCPPRGAGGAGGPSGAVLGARSPWNPASRAGLWGVSVIRFPLPAGTPLSLTPPGLLVVRPPPTSPPCPHAPSPCAHERLSPPLEGSSVGSGRVPAPGGQKPHVCRADGPITPEPPSAPRKP